MSSKQMIIAQLIKAVRVKRDYELEIDFNIAHEQSSWGFMYIKTKRRPITVFFHLVEISGIEPLTS